MKRTGNHIDLANNIADPLSSLPQFHNYDMRPEKKYKLSSHRVEDMDSETINWMMDLEENNMEELYEACGWGWNRKHKTKEMTEPSARYIIVKDTNDGKPVAFSHFRFDMDYGYRVLYCYELQLIDEVQRCGLGTFILQALEGMAIYYNMEKVVLTAIKENFKAVNFYFKMNYTVDESDPGEEATYLILSKYVRKKCPTKGN